jgi:hypothetical protein
MTTTSELLADPKVQAAIAELQQMILAQFPTTEFTVGEASDPEGVLVRAIVDVDDPDEVTNVIIDRMVDIQVDDHLPIYVVPLRTPARDAALRAQQAAARIRRA